MTEPSKAYWKQVSVYDDLLYKTGYKSYSLETAIGVTQSDHSIAGTADTLGQAWRGTRFLGRSIMAPSQVVAHNTPEEPYFNLSYFPRPGVLSRSPELKVCKIDPSALITTSGRVALLESATAALDRLGATPSPVPNIEDYEWLLTTLQDLVESTS